MSAVVEAYAALGKLGRVLLCNTLLQILGYGMKRLKLFPAAAEEGVGAFIGGVSLPAIVFRALAQLDFANVDVSILVAAVVGKLIMTAASFVLGRVALRGKWVQPGERELSGGIFAVLTTNGDELGLGLPALGAIFAPEQVSYLFLLNGVQMMLLNVLAFVLLGVGAARRDAAKMHEPPEPTAVIVASVVGGLRHNRLVQALALGALYNLCMARMRGAPLPFFLEDLVTMLAGAFAPGVFFLAGTTSVGAFAQLGCLDSAWLPLALVCLKSLILPTLVRTLVIALGGDEAAQDFGFTFGMLPAAGSSLVFVSAYAPSRQQQLLLSAALALGKLVAFPLLLLAAAILFIKDDAQVAALHAAAAHGTRLVSFGLTSYLLLSAAWYPPWLREPLRPVFLLVGLELLYVGTCLASADKTPPAAAGAASGTRAEEAIFLALSVLRWAKEAALPMLAEAEARRVERLAAARDAARRALAKGRSYSSVSAVAASAAAVDGGGGGAASAALRLPQLKLCRATSAGGPSPRRDRSGSAGGVLALYPPPPSPRPSGGAAHAAPAGPPGALRPSADEAAALLAMLGVGVAATAPWALLEGYPAAPYVRWWIPYEGRDGPAGAAMPLLYALLYAGFAACALRALVRAAVESRTVRIVRNDVRSAAGDAAAHGFSLRVEIILITTATRQLLSAAISLAALASAPPTGSVAHILLVNTTLHNGFGVLLFVLFGLSSELLAVPAARLARLRAGLARLAQRCQPASGDDDADGEAPPPPERVQGSAGASPATPARQPRLSLTRRQSRASGAFVGRVSGHVSPMPASVLGVPAPSSYHGTEPEEADGERDPAPSLASAAHDFEGARGGECGTAALSDAGGSCEDGAPSCSADSPAAGPRLPDITEALNEDSSGRSGASSSTRWSALSLNKSREWLLSLV